MTLEERDGEIQLKRERGEEEEVRCDRQAMIEKNERILSISRLFKSAESDERKDEFDVEIDYRSSSSARRRRKLGKSLSRRIKFFSFPPSTFFSSRRNFVPIERTNERERMPSKDELNCRSAVDERQRFISTNFVSLSASAGRRQIDEGQ